jgi:hypothetical protein
MLAQLTQHARPIFAAWENVRIQQKKHNWSILYTCWENSGKMDWLSWKHMCCYGNMIVSMTTNNLFHLYAKMGYLWNNSWVPTISHHFTWVGKSSLYPVLIKSRCSSSTWEYISHIYSHPRHDMSQNLGLVNSLAL